MSRPTAAAVALGAAALMVPLGAGAAIAKPIERGAFHEEFSETDPDFCDVSGLTVDIDTIVDGTFRVASKGSSRTPYLTEQIKIAQVITNTANQRFVTTKESSISKDLKVTDNGDGTSTILVLATGNATVYNSGGKAIARNPDQFRAYILINNGGTPTDPSDDEFIDVIEVVKESTGRTDDFCEAVVPALT